ncbi:hemolysin D [Desulfotomaculum copahuensis]|uniref:Hemolysin D n=2 Tax=Desulfotomaculum copahuensis TaxID=1838280 RepID=A0A1B7LBD2_9FIRM|nr:hemolysin D [Desulfotomaculum copahuensis]
MVVVLAGISYYYWHENTYYVSTDDAMIDGDVYNVSPQVAAKIIEFDVNEGQMVNAGDIIARLDDTTLPPGSNSDLAVIRAPISGVVIKKVNHVGEVAAPGYPVVMMVDPHALYVTANIEETKVNRVHPGQPVDITVDQLPGKKFTGVVTSVTRATQATFSLLPTGNTGGNFTKVTQRIPVRIALNAYQGAKLLYGASAEVKIHVK